MSDANLFPFRFIYSDFYGKVDLGGHVFPFQKYRLIYEKLLSEGAKEESFVSPYVASDEEILLVHSSEYLEKIKSGTLSQSELWTWEVPYVPEYLDFAFLTVGGTIKAAELAQEDGLTVHIGGGFHHAFSDHGEGFCILNDVAVAVEKMIQTKRVQKAMVVDCDVHQGNGTAAIFSGKDYVFTFSIHQMDLYPVQKPPSSLDVGLLSGDGDEKYLSLLEHYFPKLYHDVSPELVFYLAGADPYEHDQLGGLNVTLEGLRKRDRIILENARKLRIPVVVVFAGGYAFDIKDTVAIHINTIETAREVQQG